MFTSLLIDGVLKIVSIRKDKNKKHSVARIYNPNQNIPEAVLNEIR
jgi:hypothetical protein